MGQVEYGLYFKRADYVEQDTMVFVEWLEKAANRNNAWAMFWLGTWFQNWFEGNDQQKAVSYYRAAGELGQKVAMHCLAKMLANGEGCEQDLPQAVIWGAKRPKCVGFEPFWDLLDEAKEALDSGATETLDYYDYNQLYYPLGWGMYWYRYGSEDWNKQSVEKKAFGNRCMEYYCSCVELQQKSIFTLLLCWNRTTGVKGPGQMIAQMVWEQREDNLVQMFDESDREEPGTKRIKK
jgi:hypothetical protein